MSVDVCAEVDQKKKKIDEKIKDIDVLKNYYYIVSSGEIL